MVVYCGTICSYIMIIIIIKFKIYASISVPISVPNRDSNIMISRGIFSIYFSKKIDFIIIQFYITCRNRYV